MASPGQECIERRLAAILAADMRRREFVVLLGFLEDIWSIEPKQTFR